MASTILVIDQGTTSTRSILFDTDLRPLANYRDWSHAVRLATTANDDANHLPL